MFDRYLSIIFIALGIALFFYSRTLTTTSTGGFIGPEALPMFLAVALVFTSVINLLASLKVKHVKGKGDGGDYKKFMMLLGLLLAYVLLIEPLGYVVSTFLFLFGGFQTMEKGDYMKSAIIAAIFAGGVYYFYVQVAQGNLPGFPFVE